MSSLIKEKFIQLITIETLSVMPTAGIIQISACRFSIKNKLIESSFQVNIKPEESKNYKLDINKDTVNFWLSQPFEIKSLLLADAVNLSTALFRLTAWINEEEKIIYHPTFAMSALINAFHNLDKNDNLIPWSHYNILDLQTILSLSGTKIEKVEPRNSLKQCEVIANQLIELFNEE